MSFFIKNPFLTFGIALVILGGVFVITSYTAPKSVSDTDTDMSDTLDVIYAHEGDMKFEIADTPQKQSRGLSGRTELPEHYGMLFVFDEPSSPGIWMKDMFVSIDIIWFSDTGEIMGIEHNVAPSTYPDVFYPPVPVSYVLETRAGYAESRGWKVGDSIYLPILK